MSNKEILVEDMQNIETIISKTAVRTDIWQDRAIYMICIAIYHILGYILKKGDSK